MEGDCVIDEPDQIVVVSFRIPSSLASMMIKKIATIVGLVDERPLPRSTHIFCRAIDTISEDEREDLIEILGEGNSLAYDLFQADHEEALPLRAIHRLAQMVCLSGWYQDKRSSVETDHPRLVETDPGRVESVC